MTFRRITEHHDGHGLNESICIEALDGPGSGGASHRYVATVPSPHGSDVVADIVFQHGPRNEPGSTPGITDAVLLAIVVDRLKAFQAGPFPSREGALVLTKVQEALHWLRHRADERAARGVLGKEQK